MDLVHETQGLCHRAHGLLGRGEPRVLRLLQEPEACAQRAEHRVGGLARERGRSRFHFDQRAHGLGERLRHGEQPLGSVRGL
jgi:hypothetical protein